MDRDLWTLLAGYLLLVNLAGFLLMGLDKRRARRGAWRISEKALFLPAVLAGAWVPLWGCGPSATRRSTGISDTGCPPC